MRFHVFADTRGRLVLLSDVLKSEWNGGERFKEFLERAQVRAIIGTMDITCDFELAKLSDCGIDVMRIELEP